MSVDVGELIEIQNRPAEFHERTSRQEFAPFDLLLDRGGPPQGEFEESLNLLIVVIASTMGDPPGQSPGG